MDIDIMILILVIAAYLIGVITSVSVLSLLIRKLDRKLTYIKPLFEEYFDLGK